MSSPLQYLDGSSVVFSIISVIFSTQPPTESFSSSSNGNTSSFAFCVDEGTTPYHIFIASIAFYCFWGVLMAVISHPKSWQVVRMLPYSCIALKNSMRQAAPQPIPPPVECRGRLLLDFGITVYTLALCMRVEKLRNLMPQVYSAMLLLLVRSTSCVTLNDYDDQAGVNRWYFDGRVVCFTEGTFDGRWQIVSAVFAAVCDFHARQSGFHSCSVQVFLGLPLLLFFHMQRAIERDNAINWFDSTAVPYYKNMFRMGTRHWMVAMFYERVFLLLVCHVASFSLCARHTPQKVCNYVRMATTPFWGGFIAMVLTPRSAPNIIP